MGRSRGGSGRMRSKFRKEDRSSPGTVPVPRTPVESVPESAYEEANQARSWAALEKHRPLAVAAVRVCPGSCLATVQVAPTS